MSEEDILNKIKEIETTLTPNKAQRALTKIGKRRCCFCKEVKDLACFGLHSGTCRRRSCKICESVNAKEKWHKKRKNQSLEEAIAYKFYQAKYRSKVKNREFELLVNDVVKQWEKQNGKCYYTGLDMTIAPNNWNHFSIDRINSLEGYTTDNIVLCTHIVNLMKNDLPHDIFLEYCAMVVVHCHEMGK